MLDELEQLQAELDQVSADGLSKVQGRWFSLARNRLAKLILKVQHNVRITNELRRNMGNHDEFHSEGPDNGDTSI